KRSDTIQVDVKKSISVNLGPDVSVCASKMIQLKAFVSGATYLWRSGEVSDKITASNEGLYFVVVSKKPCYARDSIYITHRDLPRLQLSENAIVCDGDSMHFLAQSSSDSTQLTWFNGTTSPNFVAYEPGFYWVEAKNGCGAIRDSVQLIWQACFCNLHVPNAFTPDDWGANNRFGPVHSCLLIEYEFVVYNRWGQMIFQTNDPQARWNGFYGNKQSPAGVYMYTCRYQLMRGEKVNLKGVVHLLR
ncbi:MAG: gliding motility-associated-like protein, partial [Bacteroidia bacterium]